MVTLSKFNEAGDEIFYDDSFESIDSAMVASYYILAKDYVVGDYVLVSIVDEDGKTTVVKLIHQS